MYKIYQSIVLEHISKDVSVDINLNTFPNKLSNIDLVMESGLCMLLGGLFNNIMYQCYKAFGFTITFTHNTIGCGPFLGRIIRCSYDKAWNKMPWEIMSHVETQDFKVIRTYAAFDPLRFMRKYMLEINKGDPIFWKALNDRINDTIYEPVIKYLLLKDHIITNYFVDDIDRFIMMKYFDIEYARIYKLITTPCTPYLELQSNKIDQWHSSKYKSNKNL